MAAADWVKLYYETLPDSIYGVLRHNGRNYHVPALPYVDIDPRATIVFKGPLYKNVYGCTELSERGKRLIGHTLSRDPEYFNKLERKLLDAPANAPIAPIASIIMHAHTHTHANKKARVSKK